MTRGYRKRAIICSILAVVLFVVAGIYLNSQIELRNSYLNLKNGETALAKVTPLSESMSTKYSYVFTYNGKNYASTTLMSYTVEQMNSLCLTSDGLLSVKFVLDDNEVVLSTDEKSKNGLPIANSCEENYFYNSITPNLTASIVIFCVGGVLLVFALICVLQILWIKSIEKKGKFAYAVFVEAYPSRFGSNRYMAVRYSYLNDNEEWVEAVTPYAYSPSKVELLKNLEAIGIKYKGKSSVIVESFRSGL